MTGSAAPCPLAGLCRCAGTAPSLSVRQLRGHICLLRLPRCSLHNIESGKDTASTDRSFPSWKKKERKNQLYIFFTCWGKIKTPTPCARLSDGWLMVSGGLGLRSGHPPRSEGSLGGFLVNTVGSSRDVSSGKKIKNKKSAGMKRGPTAKTHCFL